MTGWDEQAGNWVRWVRTPGHDVFPYYAPSFFDEIVLEPRGRTLEVGCGEGRVARELASRGHDVVGVDASAALVRYAREAGGGAAYAVADATSLPFGDGSFGTVVAYNSLQTMAEAGDMAHAVAEAGRVLRAGGYLCVCVAHPMTDVGRLKEAPGGAAEEAPEGGRATQLVVTGSYFENERVEETVVRDGLEMTFDGWTYTLEDYTRALEDAGFVMERVREPLPRVADVASERRMAMWRRVPLFLFVRAVWR